MSAIGSLPAGQVLAHSQVQEVSRYWVESGTDYRNRVVPQITSQFILFPLQAGKSPLDQPNERARFV